ncbi:hypothetical protein MIR68_004900 [Amoeboaphelidium protococcarum]|nr:hypothetical protein MIR68_004900 [Amoeboaphelidium protococcarum]
MSGSGSQTPAVDVNQLMLINQQLQQQIQYLSDQMQQLQTHVAYTAVPPAIPLVAPTSQKKQIIYPEKFDGSVSEFRSFVNQCQLMFELHPDAFATDDIKIKTVGSLLTKKASKYYDPIIENPSQYKEELKSFDTFIACFKEWLCPASQRDCDEKALRRLKQGSMTVSAYAAEFRFLSSGIGWNDISLKSEFKEGLNNDVRIMMLSSDEPSTLSDLVKLAIRCGERVADMKALSGGSNYSKKQYSSVRSSSTQSASASTNSSASTPGPPNPDNMDIDQVKRGPLSAEERQRRLSQRLCLYCGGSGHIKANCSLLNTRTQG